MIGRESCFHSYVPYRSMYVVQSDVSQYSIYSAPSNYLTISQKTNITKQRYLIEKKDIFSFYYIKKERKATANILQ